MVQLEKNVIEILCFCVMEYLIHLAYEAKVGDLSNIDGYIHLRNNHLYILIKNYYIINV